VFLLQSKRVQFARVSVYSYDCVKRKGQFMQPVVLAITSFVGTLILARLIKREWDRVNRELYKPQPVRQEAINLRRDPRSGVYRPE